MNKAHAATKAPLALTQPLALTMGDPAGIGPEITCKAWLAMRDTPEAVFFVIGAPELYDNYEIIASPEDARDIFQTALPVLPIDCPNIPLGQPSETGAKAVTTSIQMAVDFALSGRASAVVTNPIAKHVLYAAGFTFPGHTEYLADLTQDHPCPYAHPFPRGPVMMLSAKDLRVALATIHIALKDVPNALTAETVAHTARCLHNALQMDVGISAPRIAMAGLNPHAGENGALGHEEIELLMPLAAQLRAEGLHITDPQSADTLFHEEAREGYDAVLAMYHDQGLIPVKTLDFHGGVNTTLGLPIIRTSPDHGTAFAIAGQGVARADSLIAAMKLARIMAQNRQKYRQDHE